MMCLLCKNPERELRTQKNEDQENGKVEMKKLRAAGFCPRRPLSIESRSFLLSRLGRDHDSVLPSPFSAEPYAKPAPEFSAMAKLLGVTLVACRRHLREARPWNSSAITLRFYPRRVRQSVSSKLSLPSSIQCLRGFTHAASNGFAKLPSRSNSCETGSVLPSPSL